jgi:flavin reductase (DIM6/NTAB) family NADH-FMN oxidoreductase RutF
MVIDFSSAHPRDAYSWMINSIGPRPIAWVSTQSLSGVTNLAPFSFFQAVSAYPPVLMFVPVNNRDGQKKDTLLNIEATKEFVVNVVAYKDVEAMNMSSYPLPYDESEFTTFSIPQTPSLKVKPPRVTSAAVAFECVLHDIYPVGANAQVVFGRIVSAFVDEKVLASDGYPDPAKLDLVGRLGRDTYSRTTDRFDLGRP